MDYLDDLKITLKKFADASDADLAKIDKLFSLRHCKKNEFFLRQNDQPLFSAFVTQGAFREFYSDKNGREYNKVFCFKGDFTGSYYDLEMKRPSTVSIQALTDSTIMVMLHEDYQKLVETDPFWLKAAYAFIRGLLMRKVEKEFQLLTLSASERYDLLRRQHPELENLVPAYHIASYLGITPISLSRIRAQR